MWRRTFFGDKASVRAALTSVLYRVANAECVTRTVRSLKLHHAGCHRRRLFEKARAASSSDFFSTLLRQTGVGQTPASDLFGYEAVVQPRDLALAVDEEAVRQAGELVLLVELTGAVDDDWHGDP